MSARYAALPNPRSAPDAERELADAFESDDEEDEQLESTPLTQAHNATTAAEQRHTPAPGIYDFERDYDCPPPGSPPRPSALALPNDFGNSNGQLPDSPVRQALPKPSLFRRALGGILPTHYSPVPTDSGVRVGGGLQNDGVFANVMAKPVRAKTVRTENGDVHMVPEDSSREAPPVSILKFDISSAVAYLFQQTYADAQADTVPPYWETTVHAPSGFNGTDLLVDDLPTGSMLIFAANFFTSFFFQFVGFLLTYLLHTSHAAKFGSRAGLGMTLIQYGFYSRMQQGTTGGQGDGLGWPPADPETSEPPLLSTSPLVDTAPVPEDGSAVAASSKEWMAFLLMTLGNDFTSK